MYVPKIINFKKFMPVFYPFGEHWDYEYIQESTKAIYNTFKDIKEKYITLVVQGTSGSMIAGAILTELHHLDSTMKVCISIVRKEEDINSHCPSLFKIKSLDNTIIVVVDDFVQTGKTVKEILKSLDAHYGNSLLKKRKYDMLCISNSFSEMSLKKECRNYMMWRRFFSKFKYIACCPDYDT